MASKPLLVPIKWIAGADGIAHAERKRGTRTACGRRRLVERFAWPAVQRCAECVIRLDEAAID